MKTIKIQIPEGMSANVRTTANGLNVSFNENTIINWESDDTTITWDNEPLVRNPRQCGMSGYIGLLALIKLRNEIYGATMEPTLLEQVEHLAPFKLTNVQKELVNAIQNNDKLIIRKTRQVGMTEIFAMITAIRLCYESNVAIRYYTYNSVATNRFIRIVERYLDSLKAIKYPWSKGNIKMSNGASLLSTCNRDDISSGDCNWMIVDEAAFINRNISVFEMISDKITVASTLNGLENTFLPMWLRANKLRYKRFTLEKCWKDYSDYHMRVILGDKFNYEYGDQLQSALTLRNLEYILENGMVISVDKSDKDNINELVKFMLHNHIDFKCEDRNIISYPQ